MESLMEVLMRAGREAEAENRELIFLGTGNAMAKNCYNTCFVIRGGREFFLVDAGGGNQILQRLDRTGVGLSSLHEMFVSHCHTDHILGAIWVVRTIWQQMKSGEYEGTFTVYGHEKVLTVLYRMCEDMLHGWPSVHFGSGLVFREVMDGDVVPTEVGMMQFFDLQSEKEKQFGFRLTFSDGYVLAYMGDEPVKESVKKYGTCANLLLHEAFCLEDRADVFHPYEKHHSTAADAAKAAAELEAEKLLLYHTEDTMLEERKVRYTQEAAKYFTGEIFVPDDLERIGL